jgi:predicted hydrocarbon binding protein
VTHLQKWIGTVVDGLDDMVDEKTRITILENCGRTCISPSFVKKAINLKEKSGSNKEFLDKLAKTWSHLKLEGKNIFVVYNQCYCPLVKSYEEKLSKSFCNCSRGWVKELFESSLKKPVTVILEKSIKQGDEICRFRVKL